MKPLCGLSLFIDRQLRALGGPQKNNDSDEMAPLKSSSRFLLHFSSLFYCLPFFSGHINIHTNEEHPKEQAFLKISAKLKYTQASKSTYTQHAGMVQRGVLIQWILITDGFQTNAKWFGKMTYDYMFAKEITVFPYLITLYSCPL